MRFDVDPLTLPEGTDVEVVDLTGAVFRGSITKRTELIAGDEFGLRRAGGTVSYMKLSRIREVRKGS